MSKNEHIQGLNVVDKDRIIIFDTTLRDGEQSPGCSMNKQDKLRIAHLLASMGVDVIEAGFPIASIGDFEAVKAIATDVKGARIAGLCRAQDKDIDRAWEAVKPAEKARIHTFISTSPVHMKHKLRMEPEAVLDAIVRSVSRARNYCDDVEWSPEDGTRTEPDFLCRAVELAIKHGATTVNIPDTVGYMVADEYAELIQMLINRVPNIDKAIISVHCHNDLGMAVSNSLAGCLSGARQIECTINGIGERAGNASLEEVVMAMRTRHDALPLWTNVDTTKIMQASRLLGSITGFGVQPNKAIVGANAFAHESGIHQDGMLKNVETYEIMRPEWVGLKESNLVLGKHSGRHAFRDKLEQMGYVLDDNQFNDTFIRFKELADHKKEIFDEDIIALIDEGARVNDHITFNSLSVHCGVKGPHEASIGLYLENKADLQNMTANGNGPVDAIFNAITALSPHKAHLELYQVHAVTGGTDAQAEVSVRLMENGLSVTGSSADYDTLVASAKAYINALNKLIDKRKRAMQS